jgi:hypothetical protein
MRRCRSWARVVLRRGMVSPAVCLAGGLPVTVNSAVGVQSSGNSIRLPGWVVEVWPSGSVQVTVPSGDCWSCQPGQNVFNKW